jgi:prevent-host-death family protein
MKLSTAVKPISYLKAHASELIRDITNTRQTLVVTHNGEAKVVVQDIRSYERMQETLALLKILTRSKQNIRRGRSKSMDEVFRSLDKRIVAFKRKKYDVTFDWDAEDDLFDIYVFVAVNDSVEKADRLFAALRRTCLKLQKLPLRGNIPPELFEIGVVEFREQYYTCYRIIYSLESTTVYVHSVLDARRDIQEILQERLLR